MKVLRVRNRLISVLCLLISAFSSRIASGQSSWYYQWGLLPDSKIDLLIGLASGEQAHNTIIDLSDFNRSRDRNEFRDSLFESIYIIKKLREFGLDDVVVEKFGETKSYFPETGVLWEVSPHREKIADIKDLPFVLVPGSSNCDTEGELVFVPDADQNAIQKLQLSGKIIITPLNPYRIIKNLAGSGARGIVSYYSPRPLENKLMIPDAKGWGFRQGGSDSLFVFAISPRDGVVLHDRLARGEKIIVHALVKHSEEKLQIQVPGCCIRGTDKNAGEVIISAHLFEGYSNQGANDNISGAASELEVARILCMAIKDGSLERPRRTIRFIWIPEYTGSIKWTDAHKDLTAKTLCDINLDMVGLSLSRYRSYFVLHRTSYGNAHYVNDVVENYYRFVNETNQKNSVISGSEFFKRIVAPKGTDDPFYYQVETTSGGSDHDVFNDWGVGVPGVLLITWPDPFYHTSLDRADKTDPTQLKRAVFITAASAYTIASAGKDEALRICGEVYGNAVKRTGYSISKASAEVTSCAPANINQVMKRAVSDLLGSLSGEIAEISSTVQLMPGDNDLLSTVKSYSATLKEMTESFLKNIIQTATVRAKAARMAPPDIKPDGDWMKFYSLVPVIVNSPKAYGFQGYAKMLEELPGEIKAKYPVGDMDRLSEAALCINGRNRFSDILNMLNAQEKAETSPEELMNYLNRLKAAGFINFK